MLSLFKRANGTYYILYLDGTKRRWKSTGTSYKPEAQRKLEEFDHCKSQTRKRRQTPRESHPKTTPSCTLETFIADFLTYAQATFAPKTVDIYRRSLNRFSNLTGNKTLTALSSRDTDIFRARRLQEHLSPTTVNIETRSLRAAFATAVRWKMIQENPWREMKPLRIPEEQPAFLGKEDFARLIDAAHEPWLQEIIIAAVSTGLRRGELLNLQWKDVNLAERIMNIQSSDAFKTKAGKRRVVPLNEVVLELLKRKSLQGQKEYVFSWRGRKVRPDHFTRKFKQAARRAGLDPRLHVHSLRHTFATWLVQEGISIYEIQKLLGHSSIAVTQVYAHLATPQLHQAVETIAKRINPLRERSFTSEQE